MYASPSRLCTRPQQPHLILTPRPVIEHEQWHTDIILGNGIISTLTAMTLHSWARVQHAASTQVLYERALAAFPVTADLWQQYGRYVEANLKIPGVINAVYARAVS
jgi:hypothetical protein